MRTELSLAKTQFLLKRVFAGKTDLVRIVLEDGQKLMVFAYLPPRYSIPNQAWWADVIICHNPGLLPDDLRTRACLSNYAGLVQIDASRDVYGKTVIAVRKVV